MTPEGGAGLKVKLSVSRERYQELRAQLLALGIEEDENAELLLIENNRWADSLMVKSLRTNELVRLPAEEIITVETLGRSVEVHALDGTYQARERLYRLEALLGPERFLRISNCVLIAVDKVRSISPTLSMKFILTMCDGRKVDVTRSYYYIFKERFGI